MQDMLFRETDRTKYLMGDSSAFCRGFSAADFRRSSFQKRCFIKTIAMNQCVSGRPRRCKRGCSFASKPREVMLDCLKFPNRSFKGDPLIGIRDSHGQNRL